LLNDYPDGRGERNLTSTTTTTPTTSKLKKAYYLEPNPNGRLLLQGTTDIESHMVVKSLA
jgi:hypothetical protein